MLRRNAKTTHGVRGAEKKLSSTSITADDKQNGNEIFGIAVLV